MRRRFRGLLAAVLAFGMLGATVPPAGATPARGPVEYAICLYEQRDPFACEPPAGDLPPVDPNNPAVPSVPSLPGTTDEILNLLCGQGLYPSGVFCIFGQPGQLGPKLTAIRHYLLEFPGKGEVRKVGKAVTYCLHDNPDPDRVARFSCILLEIIRQ